MAHPFPSMNPWLENPLLWSDVHHSLITALRDDLAPRLRPRYFVAVETHTYITLPPDWESRLRRPDVLVRQRRLHEPGSGATATLEYAPYLKVEMPLHDPIEEGYLEVRLVPTGEVVTVIELLSHTNKQRGPERNNNIAKRRSLLDSHVHFVEIDLLRDGPQMPCTEKARSDYRVFIRRREGPNHARLYPFNVRQAVPNFPLPLLPDDEEPEVNMSALLAQVYERAGYDLVINYAQPPEPPLNDDDAQWAAELLSRLEAQPRNG